MLHQLEEELVSDIVLESRGTADDRRDLQLADALRGQRLLARSLRLSHVVGRTEPMLWIPDAVCGAIVSARVGVPGHQAVLASRLRIIPI